MHSSAAIARSLAAEFVAGPFDVESLVDRGSRLLGHRWLWLRPLAVRVTESFQRGTRPRQASVAKFILSDRGFLRACQKHRVRLADRLGSPAVMCPIKPAEPWEVPELCSATELADWLGIGLGHLEWFADLHSLEHKCNQGRLRHYHYRPLAKRFGQIRLVEAPKPRLKDIQRRILTGILSHIPTHDAAHGFCRGRSIKTFTASHIGQRVVLRLDLQDFFPSISASRVRAIFRSAGYPEAVSDLLAGLCTNCAPVDVWDAVTLPTWQLRHSIWRYGQPHLPQGAPTSPALANLCAYRLDCRLSGLARAGGAVYTRYADDLAFSGGREFERAVKRFSSHASATIMEEGFTVHHRKTRIMRQGVRQHLAGVVVNRHTNCRRADYDRLKATLVNSIRQGPDSQNRAGHDDFRAHLNGRVAFIEMLNPARGKRLRELLDRIEW
jgi:hypothetical protein